MSRRLAAWAMAVPPAVLAVVAFLPALDNGFVQLDDYPNFLYNPYYRGLGRSQLLWAWTTDWLGVYQPMGWMLLEAQYAAFGLDPRGYHLTSVLLHALTAVALYAMTLALLRRARPDLSATNPTGVVLGSAMAAAVWVAHPMRVEAVAWASCQSYLPCAAASMLSVAAYLGAADAPPPRRARGLAASWGLLALALLFKAPAVAVPAVLVVLDYYPLRRLGGGPGRWFGPAARPVWLEKIPFFVLGLAFAAMAVRARQATDSLVPLELFGWLPRVAMACYGAGFYLWKTVWPAGLCAYYPMPAHFDARSAGSVACIALVTAVTAVLIRLRRRHPGLLSAWLAYLVLLAPHSGLLRIGTVIVADRYSLLPTTAVVPLLAAAIAHLTRPGRARTPVAVGVAAAGVAVIAVFIASSWSLCRTWRDTFSLASHALAQGGRDSPELLTGLAWALEQRGDLEGADARFCEALRISPLHVPAINGLGMVRLRRGRVGNAAALLAEAVRLRPGVAETRNSLGQALAARGRPEEAAAQFAEAIRLRPDYPEARKNLAIVRSRMRRGSP